MLLLPSKKLMFVTAGKKRERRRERERREREEEKKSGEVNRAATAL